MVRMKTNMNRKVFKVMINSMTSDIHRNNLVFEGDQIKVNHTLPLTIWTYIMCDPLFVSFPACSIKLCHKQEDSNISSVLLLEMFQEREILIFKLYY